MSTEPKTQIKGGTYKDTQKTMDKDVFWIIRDGINFNGGNQVTHFPRTLFDFVVAYCGKPAVVAY